MENEEFILKLAEYQEKMKKSRKNILEKYNKLNFEIDDICDINTGAVFFEDEDSVIKKAKFNNHPIFKIFDINCIEPHRKYTLNLNDKIILRGPENYYYGFCYIGDLDIKIIEIITTLEKVKRFANIAKKYIYGEKLNYTEILDLKLVVAILDILRNSILTNLFFLLMRENEIQDIYLFGNKKSNLINEMYELLMQVEKKAIDIIIYQSERLESNIIILLEKFIIIQEKLIQEINNHKELYQNDLYIRYRKLREADNLMENILCIKDAVDNIIKEKREQLKDIYVFGINYGSLELACIANIILKKEKINCYNGNIMKKFRKVYIKAANYQKVKEGNEINKNKKYILVDENIMTGQTLQKVNEYLKNYELENIDTIIIQYPTVARIKNIIENVEKEGYLTLINSLKGMISPVKYSKMCEYRKDFIFPYMDKLGNFDLYKSIILKNLYKNGEYNENSSVARISEYYKERFI